MAGSTVTASRYAINAARSAAFAMPAKAIELPGTILLEDSNHRSNPTRSHRNDCARKAAE
jgi:hypothetical protein